MPSRLRASSAFRPLGVCVLLGVGALVAEGRSQASPRSSATQPQDAAAVAPTTQADSLTVLDAVLSPRSPEDRRLKPSRLIEALLAQDMYDLLDGYLHDLPRDQVEAQLLLRRVKLGVYNDPASSNEKKLAAIQDANFILDDLIAGRPDDMRNIDWQLTLGKSLLFDEAEPYYNSILFRGGSPEDARKLTVLMTKTTSILSRLTGKLKDIETAFDDMDPGLYDRLERSGYVDKVESLRPQGEYLLRWAQFYSALAMAPGDPERSRQLRSVLDYLTRESKLLTIPHAQSHYQAQSLLLAGMSCRLMGETLDAIRYLNNAIQAAESITDAEERDSLRWVVVLGKLEKIKSYRDTQEFESARTQLGAFRIWVSNADPENFGLFLVAALMEGEVDRAEAAMLERLGQLPQAKFLRSRSRRPLLDLAQKYPERREEIYANIYQMVEGTRDPAALDAFEKCVLLAHLLQQAADLEKQGYPAAAEQGRRLLTQGAELARAVMEDPSSLAAEMKPEAVFNLGVCEYQLGNPVEAVEQFINVTANHRGFNKQNTAANYAVQIASQLYSDPKLRENPVVPELFRRAIWALIVAFPDSAEAVYWQFHIAQVLEYQGRFDEAAAEYARVDPDHENASEAMFRRVFCSFRSLSAVEVSSDEISQKRWRDAQSLITSADSFIAEAKRKLLRTGGAQADRLYDLLAQANLISAEVCVLDGVGLGETALKRLEGFEREFGHRKDLLGRVLRTRMIALQQMGSLNEAARIIPDYINEDPENAGATLQGLLNSLFEAIHDHRQRGQDQAADRKAGTALAIAEQIYEWARRQGSKFDEATVQGLRSQLARATLEAGRYDKALELFERCIREDAQGSPNGESRDGALLNGKAEALFQLQRYEEALLLFGDIYQRSAEGSPLWWQSLLRDLQCRNALGHPAEGLNRVIQQKRSMFKNALGDPLQQRQFDALEEQIKARTNGGASP